MPDLATTEAPPTLTPLAARINLPLLRKALELPIYMPAVFIENKSSRTNIQNSQTYEQCGSVGCIAGNVILLSDIKYRYYPDMQDASKLLNLTEQEGRHLFTINNNYGMLFLWGPYTPERQLRIYEYVRRWLKANGAEEEL